MHDYAAPRARKATEPSHLLPCRATRSSLFTASGAALLLVGLWIAGCSGGSDAVAPILVGSVAVGPAATTLTSLGATQQLTATPKDANGNALSGRADPTWKSSDATIATVSTTGLVTAVGNGSVTVTATIEGISGTATVTIGQVVAAVTVTPGNDTLAALGATQPLTATPQDGNGHPVLGQTITWGTSSNLIATVNNAGLVTAMANGSATITATVGGVSGTATVTVAQVVTSVTVTPGTATLGTVGATQSFTAALKDALGNAVTGKTVTWSSSNPGFATVSNAGLVTAVASGTTTITATVGSVSGTATVNVALAVASVTLTPPTSTLTALGAQVQLTATPLDAGGNAVPGQTVTWLSSDPTIATVTTAGLVTAVKNGGPVTITATVGNKSAPPATVTVAQVVSAVVVTPSTTTLSALGAAPAPLVASPQDANGHPVPGQTVSWASSNTAIAIVNATTGLVTAVANGGPVTITATVGSVSGTASVTVAQVIATVTISTQPSATVQTGVVFPTVPAVTVKDASGAPVANQAVSVTVASGAALSFTNGTATTNSSGVATFTGLTATGAVGARTLQFGAGVVVSAPSVTVTLNAGAAAVVTITTQPATTVQSGTTFATVPAVTVTDGSNNPVANQAVTVSVASGNALTFANGTATTNGSGVATFTGLAATGQAGDRTLKFTAGAAVSAASGTVTVTAGVAATVTITTQPAATVQSGVAFPTVPAVTVTDGSGNVLANQAVTVSVASGGPLAFTNGAATTNASGVATFAGLAATGVIGARTLQFTAGTAVSAASSSVTVNAGLAATVTITTQPAATVQSGVAFPTVPAVTVSDGSGNVVANQAVTVSVASGGALAFTAGTATTNASGVATFTGLAATGAIGARTLQFTAGAALSPASTTVTVNAGLPGSVTITTQPSATVQSGVTFPTVPVVTVTDGSGNVVANQAVTVSVATGSALTFTNGTATSNGSGVATFTGLLATGTLGDRTLKFTAGTAVSPASNTVTVTVGAAAAVAITTQPAATVQSGVLFPTVPVVTVTDAGGNPVASQAVTVSVATGSALTFTSGTATTDVNGVATFTGLVATGLIGARTLKFTAGTAVSAASNTVTVNAGLAASVAITTQPAATVQVGVVFPTVPAVTVTDASGNLVPNQAVTVSVASGGALTFTAGTATSNGSGVATFTGLKATGVLGPRTLQFTAGTAVSAASNTVTVSSGPPGIVTIITQPPAAVQSGVLFPTVPVVTVTDSGGNPVATQAVTVSVATGTALTFTNGTATTDVNGVGTFTGLVATGLIGARTLKFTAGTAVSAASSSVTVNAGLPKTVTITTQPSATVQSGVVFPVQPVVTVRDSLTNLVPNQLVTVTVDSGSPLTFTNATATTNSLGVATYVGLSATGVIGNRHLRFTAGTAFATSALVTLQGGALAKIVVTPTTTMLLTSANSQQLTATPQDSAGNILTGQPAPTWSSSNSGIAAVSGTGLVTTTGTTPGTVTITATISTVSGTASVMVGQVAMVTNYRDNSVSVLNGTTVQATVPYTSGDSTLDIAITPDGSKAYVTNNFGGNVSIIRLGTNTVLPSIALGAPRGVAISPNCGPPSGTGCFAYLTQGAPNNRFVIWDTVTNTEVLNIPAGSSPRYLLATTTDVWITDSGPAPTHADSLAKNGQVLRYSRGSGSITDQVAVKATPYGLALNGSTLYVTNRDSNSVSVISTSGALSVTTTIRDTSFHAPWGIAVTPNGTAYVANSGSTTVTIISTATNTVTGRITGFTNPAGITVTAGGTAYVANSGGNTVTLVTTATNAVSGTVTVGAGPRRVALRTVQ